MTNFSAVDVLRAYTRQFESGHALDEDGNIIEHHHQPADAARAGEFVQKWSAEGDGTAMRELNLALHEKTGTEVDWWAPVAAIAEDYDVPLDEFIGAVLYVAEHNGAYGRLPRDQMGCAVGEIVRVLSAVKELIDPAAVAT